MPIVNLEASDVADPPDETVSSDEIVSSSKILTSIPSERNLSFRCDVASEFGRRHEPDERPLEIFDPNVSCTTRKRSVKNHNILRFSVALFPAFYMCVFLFSITVRSNFPKVTLCTCSKPP
jgi:hypothetical protein